MPFKSLTISPEAQQALQKMGLNIRKARLRKNISLNSLAKQAQISMDTLASVEKGSSKVSIGAYASVLTVLGLEKDFEAVAYDELGRKEYWEHNYLPRKRASRGR